MTLCCPAKLWKYKAKNKMSCQLLGALIPLSRSLWTGLWSSVRLHVWKTAVHHWDLLQRQLLLQSPELHRSDCTRYDTHVLWVYISAFQPCKPQPVPPAPHVHVRTVFRRADISQPNTEPVTHHKHTHNVWCFIATTSTVRCFISFIFCIIKFKLEFSVWF